MNAKIDKEEVYLKRKLCKLKIQSAVLMRCLGTKLFIKEREFFRMRPRIELAISEGSMTKYDVDVKTAFI